MAGDHPIQHVTSLLLMVMEQQKHWEKRMKERFHLYAFDPVTTDNLQLDSQFGCYYIFLHYSTEINVLKTSKINISFFMENIIVFLIKLSQKPINQSTKNTYKMDQQPLQSKASTITQINSFQIPILFDFLMQY